MGALHPENINISAMYSRDKSSSVLVELGDATFWTSIDSETAAQLKATKDAYLIQPCSGDCMLPTDPSHPFFMVSAELLLGERHFATPCDDVLSAGVLLFYMLFGRHPIAIKAKDTYKTWLKRLKEGDVTWPEDCALLFAFHKNYDSVPGTVITLEYITVNTLS
jgi:hypothetical protein